MKKYLVVGMFLILVGCDVYIRPNNRAIVVKISADGNSFCTYQTKAISDNLIFDDGEKIWLDIVDTCGKFNIGDTVQLNFVKSGVE
jgi:hypothetical protein